MTDRNTEGPDTRWQPRSLTSLANAVKNPTRSSHPDVAKVLKAKDNQYLEELEEILKRPVLVKSDPTLHNEKFDLG